MKLYVGAWSDGDGGVFAVEAGGAARPLAGGGAGDAPRMAFAILADHVKDAGRAQALRGGFERRFGARLRGSFWTVRESEVAEAVALIERGGRAA